MQKLLSVTQASELLQVSDSLVYELVASGQLLCYRLGKGRGTIRFDFARHLLPYLENAEVDKGVFPVHAKVNSARFRHLG
jgi:excisionase family DNA binding protein